MFPVIRNISDVLAEHSQEWLEEQGFVFLYKDHYTVIDYVVTKEHTFETPMMRELRGIKFCAQSGDIVARPLHKFFNVGESRCVITDEDLGDCTIYEKLDGSMVHLTSMHDTWMLHTRKGSSDQAAMATRHLVMDLDVEMFLDYKDFHSSCVKAGLTPIYEFCAPNNRIVVEYPEPKLVLLAVRDNVTGEYLDYRDIGAYYGIPTAELLKLDDIPVKDFVESKENFEGVVVRNAKGFAKIKNSDYLLKHKTVDQLKFEKDVICLCLDGLIDDILPILDEGKRQKLLDYNEALTEQVIQSVAAVVGFTYGIIDSCETRKQMAAKVQEMVPKHLQGIVFKYMDAIAGNYEEEYNLPDVIKKVIKFATNSSTKVEDQRDKFLKGVPKW